MDCLEKIELVRRLLNNGASMNMSKEILLELSKKVDQYIVDYYQKFGDNKNTQCETKECRKTC